MRSCLTEMGQERLEMMMIIIYFFKNKKKKRLSFVSLLWQTESADYPSITLRSVQRALIGFEGI